MDKIKPHISIFYNFDNIPHIKGTTKKGIKSEINFFDQFLISYYSINENWINNKFTFDFYITHSLPFHPDKLNVNLRQVDTHLNHVKRYHSLLEGVECDYKLLLDNDTVGLKVPNFDFTKDALIGYSGSKYNYQEWEKICRCVCLELPPQHPIKTNEEARYYKFEADEYLFYYNNFPNYNLFPSVNAGALLIKNSLSKSLGELLKESSIKYHNYILERDKVNIGYVSQDIYGLCVNHITKNWSHLEHGFNFLLSGLPSFQSLVTNYPLNKISLFHYINTKFDEDYRFISIIQKYKQKVLN